MELPGVPSSIVLEEGWSINYPGCGKMEKNPTRWCWLDWFQESTQRAKSNLQSHTHMYARLTVLVWTHEYVVEGWESDLYITHSLLISWSTLRNVPSNRRLFLKNQGLRHGGYKGAEVAVTHSRVCPNKRSKDNLTSFVRHGSTNVGLNVAKAFEDRRRVEHNRTLKDVSETFSLLDEIEWYLKRNGRGSLFGRGCVRCRGTSNCIRQEGNETSIFIDVGIKSIWFRKTIIKHLGTWAVKKTPYIAQRS